MQSDLRRIVAQLPADCTVLLDLYVTAGQAPDDDPERSAEKIRESLGTLPAPLDRVAVAVRRAGSDERSSWFTFHPSGNTAGADAPGANREPVEDRTLRGLHPMVAERLGLWRLTNFTLTRLPSPIDVHLFRAVGRNVPDDRRLVVLSDVRDLSVVRDAHGRVRALPQLEHVLDACLDALRAARARPIAPTPARTGTACCSTCGRWWTCRSTSSTASSAGWRPAPRGWGWSRSSCSSGWHPSWSKGARRNRRSCSCACRGHRGPG